MKIFTLALFLFVHTFLFAQNTQRIRFTSIIPAVNTGQDYSSWLSDDLNNLVPNVWSKANLRWVDITLKLEQQSNISRLSFYDFEGVFTDKPAYIYALNGTVKTYLGLFTGETYETFVNLKLKKAVIADAIIIRKYNNNIPQKVQVYGVPLKTQQNIVAGKIQSVINFAAMAERVAGEDAFNLKAGSNNTAMPITFTSSDPAVVTVSNISGSWKATPVNAGIAVITASQAGNAFFTAANNVTEQQVVQPFNLRKIPLTGKYWYQLNNTGDNITAASGLPQLSDGNITDAVFMGWSKLLPNYDCYYEFKNLSKVMISKIRFYDGEGIFTDKPFKLYAKATVNAVPVLLASFTGESYNQWVEINLPAPVPAQYLVANVWSNFPLEMELYGSYETAPAITSYPQKEIKFGAMGGVNSFVWDFLENWNDPNIRNKIFEPKLQLLNTFTQYRDYVDWEKIEPAQGNYTFNPTQFGSWNYDVVYKRLKEEGKDVVACLKTLPAWFLNQYYPSDQQDSENVPAPYGSDLLNPDSYILQAKLAFQFAARYGSNKNIASNLQNGVNTDYIYASAPQEGVRTKETGLGYIKYIECENERDKWWKGRKAYQTAREYAANLSAFYDGNKNTMGAGVGVKNADPNMLVVIGGTASTTTDYVRGIIDWCKEFRGYKANGSVNLCFDVINYHYYSNNSGTSQDGNATGGAAPELSGSAAAATAFTDLAKEINAEVWITESGYDANPHSPIAAPAIGSKTAEEVQADWILRSALLYAQTGINRLFFYETYDQNIDSWGQFGSSGLLNAATRKRKIAADYLLQTNRLIGAFTYKETLESNPAIHRYQLKDTAVYVAYVPLAEGKTMDYTLKLGTATEAKIYTLKTAQDSMDVKEASLVNNSLTLKLTETPVFIKVLSPDLTLANNVLVKALAANTSGTGLDKLMPAKTQYSSDSTSNEFTNNFASLTAYPNPTANLITVSLDNHIHKPVSIKIFNAATGIIVKQIAAGKSADYFAQQIDISTLPAGIYVMEITQGNTKIKKKIIKQ